MTNFWTQKGGYGKPLRQRLPLRNSEVFIVCLLCARVWARHQILAGGKVSQLTVLQVD